MFFNLWGKKSKETEDIQSKRKRKLITSSEIFDGFIRLQINSKELFRARLDQEMGDTYYYINILQTFMRSSYMPSHLSKNKQDTDLALKYQQTCFPFSFSLYTHFFNWMIIASIMPSQAKFESIYHIMFLAD